MYEISRRILFWSKVIITVPSTYQVTVLRCGGLMIRDEKKGFYKAIASGEWHSARMIESTEEKRSEIERA
jgi:hypothetical protein